MWLSRDGLLMKIDVNEQKYESPAQFVRDFMAKNASFVSLLFLEGPVGDFWSVFVRESALFFFLCLW